MAQPREIFIFANCGLEIEIDNITEFDGVDITDSSECWKYSVTNYDTIRRLGRRNSVEMNGLGGMLSPISPVTLPPMVRERAGIPPEAATYAFMYPPVGLAEKLMQEDRNETFSDCLDIDTSNKINEEGVVSAAVLGGFAYFNKHCQCIRINAFSLSETERTLKFGGPFEVSPSICDELIKLGRRKALNLDIFHELGFVSYAWVRPREQFDFMNLFEKNVHPNKNGSMVFFRENGTGVAYAVDPSGKSDPHGYVGILSEAMRHIGISKLTKRGIQPIDEVNAWGDRVKCRNRPMTYTELLDTIPDKRKLLHMVCHAALGQDFLKHVIEKNLVERQNLSYQDSIGWNPLHYACCFSSCDNTLIRMLVNECPNAVTQLDHYNRSPLHIACNSDGSKEVIAILLEADTHKVTLLKKTRRLGFLPLHFVCFNNERDGIIKALLDADRVGKSATTRAETGHLPLHLAIMKRLSVEIVKALLDADSKVHNSDSHSSDGHSVTFDSDIYQAYDGKLPLHLACFHNSSSEIVRLLLEKDEQNTTINETVEVADDMLETHIYIITRYKQRKSLRHTNKRSILSLNDVVSQTTLKDGDNGVVALHLAIRHGCKEVISLLLKKEVENKNTFQLSTLHMRDIFGRTPLHIACMYNIGSDVVHLLLKLDPTRQTTHMEDYNGFMPIHYACDNKDTSEKTIDALLAGENKFIEKAHLEGISIRRSTHCGDTERNRTPLYLAIKNGVNTKVVKRLLQPEYFTLSGFDDPHMCDLSVIVSGSQAVQDEVINRLSERVYFSLIMMELYACLGALVSFTIASIMYVEKTITTKYPSLMLCCTAVFILRELLQIMSVGADYVGDIWSWFELVGIIFQILTSFYMFDKASNPESSDNAPSTIFAVTGFLLVFQVITYLRLTFLPFARFVGGFVMILRKLMPFLVVSTLTFFAFVYAVWITEITPNCQGTIYNCASEQFKNLLDFSPEGLTTLDIAFGILIIIVLLNVVIAIVGEAWSSAAGKTNRIFWKYRLEKTFELRYAVKLRDRMRKRILNRSSKYSFGRNYKTLMKRIDNFQNISYGGDISWTKAPYNMLTKKEHYDRPQQYFSPEDVRKVYEAHSLQADLYWAKMDGEVSGYDNFIIILKWLLLCMMYAILILVGIPTFGVFFPKKFRVAVLSLGLRGERTREEEETTKQQRNGLQGEGAIKQQRKIV